MSGKNYITDFLIKVVDQTGVKSKISKASFKMAFLLIKFGAKTGYNAYFLKEQGRQDSILKLSSTLEGMFDDLNNEYDEWIEKRIAEVSGNDQKKN